MKNDLDRLMQAKKTAALVEACSVSIDQAVKAALSCIAGTVVDARLKEKDDHVVWRIKLLTTEGRVKLYVDGRTGGILEARTDRYHSTSGNNVALERRLSERREVSESPRL